MRGSHSLAVDRGDRRHQLAITRHLEQKPRAQLASARAVGRRPPGVARRLDARQRRENRHELATRRPIAAACDRRQNLLGVRQARNRAACVAEVRGQGIALDVSDLFVRRCQLACQRFVAGVGAEALEIGEGGPDDRLAGFSRAGQRLNATCTSNTNVFASARIS
jgi:hypothetical protein